MEPLAKRPDQVRTENALAMPITSDESRSSRGSRSAFRPSLWLNDMAPRVIQLLGVIIVAIFPLASSVAISGRLAVDCSRLVDRLGHFRATLSRYFRSAVEAPFSSESRSSLAAVRVRRADQNVLQRMDLTFARALFPSNAGNQKSALTMATRVSSRRHQCRIQIHLPRSRVATAPRS